MALSVWSKQKIKKGAWLFFPIGNSNFPSYVIRLWQWTILWTIYSRVVNCLQDCCKITDLKNVWDHVWFTDHTLSYTTTRAKLSKFKNQFLAWACDSQFYFISSRKHLLSFFLHKTYTTFTPFFFKPGADVINKCYSSIAKLFWNKPFWLVKNSHRTWKRQSECFISA